MSDQQNWNAATSREKKRAQFTEEKFGKSGKKALIVWALVIGAAVAAYVWFANTRDDKPTVVTTSAAKPESGEPANELRVSISDVAGNRAKFFDYKLANNQPLRFFVVKSSEGDYRAALDACEVCAHAKKGYHQEGDDMICNNCGKHFATALIGKVQGGCHPVGLSLKTEGSEFVIKKSELEAGAKYF